MFVCLFFKALQIEAVTSGRKNAAIEMKWVQGLDTTCSLHSEDTNMFPCRELHSIFASLCNEAH